MTSAAMSAFGKREVVQRALALMISSAALLLVGMVRMKFAATRFGPAFVGILGQASIVQVFAVTVVTAGLLTAARLELSEAGVPQEELLSRAGWAFRSGGLRAVLMCLPVVVLAGPVAHALTGQADARAAFLAAALGVPLQCASLTGLVVAQTLAPRPQLMMSTLVGAVASLALVSWSMLGEPWLAAASLALAPAGQAMGLIVASGTVRHGIRRCLRRGPRRGRRTYSSVARVSLVVGVAGLVLDMSLRSSLAHSWGLRELGLLQPSLLLATQGFTLVTSSLTQAIVVALNRSRLDGVGLLAPWRLAVRVAAVEAAVCSIILVLAPVLIRVFFSADLLPGRSALAIALAVEPARALAWIAGCTLLPEGRVRTWLGLQVVGLASQAVVTLWLMPAWGVAAIPTGAFVSVGVIVFLLLLTTAPSLTKKDVTILLLVVLGDSAIAGAAVATWVELGLLAVAIHALAALIAVSSVDSGGFPGFDASPDATKRAVRESASER